MPIASICIACHNQAYYLYFALYSCFTQIGSLDYEIIVLDDASTDKTKEVCDYFPNIKYFRSDKPSGSGGAFNKAIAQAMSDIVVLLCADDFFTDCLVMKDILTKFDNKAVDHVSRYYYQFIDGDERPVRAWRGNNIIELANNPSGLAFRRSAIQGLELTNKMFIEAPYLVSQIKGKSVILKYDTVAVRIHQSTARSKDYYKKMWTSSPIEEWVKIGGTSLLKDHTSLIQIKVNFTMEAVVKEIWNFIRLRPLNLIMPSFWFFSIIALITPRPILYKVPEIYRSTIGRWTTRKIIRL